ncbi:hypothetical protein ONZ45_g12184 [Pleurotus djamor]|nr:hypothetical protein ONZ45_g12184 [Pleurotus djamor]
MTKLKLKLNHDLRLIGDAHAMDLHAKREFLKAASLEAASGSLQGMKALERCLNDSHPSELSNLLVALAKATLIGLSFSKIPTSACEQNTIEHATLSLSCLAHLVQFDGTEEETLMPVLLERQEIVFPWLSFLLLLHNDSLLDNAQAPGLPLVLIISAILGYFSHNLVYYESFNVYAFNTIVEVWHRLQATTTLAPDLVTLAELVNNLFGWLVRAALVQHPIGYFVERVGGVSRVPALYAASLEKYHQIIALNPPSEHYPFLVLTVQNSFTLMYLFLHKLLPYATLSEACMRQVNQSIKQLFIHHSQLHLRSMVDDLRSSYIRFIFECPATAGYYPILHMLQLGIAEDFRALESRSSVVEQVTQLLGVYAKFPAALPFIERFVCLPANRHAAADWATTDDAMSPCVSIWNAAQAEAKQYTGCTTSALPAVFQGTALRGVNAPTGTLGIDGNVKYFGCVELTTR